MLYDIAYKGGYMSDFGAPNGPVLMVKNDR